MHRDDHHRLILDCNRSAQLARQERSGVRDAHERRPTGVFEAVELAVLVVVAALAMASIIVSTGCSGIEGASAQPPATRPAPPTRPA